MTGGTLLECDAARGHISLQALQRLFTWRKPIRAEHGPDHRRATAGTRSRGCFLHNAVHRNCIFAIDGEVREVNTVRQLRQLGPEQRRRIARRSFTPGLCTVIGDDEEKGQPVSICPAQCVRPSRLGGSGISEGDGDPVSSRRLHPARRTRAKWDTQALRHIMRVLSGFRPWCECAKRSITRSRGDKVALREVNQRGRQQRLTCGL